jgi:hypothetical protein
LTPHNLLFCIPHEWVHPVKTRKKQAAAGFEPANNGFANRRLRPLGYAARFGFGAKFRAVLPSWQQNYPVFARHSQIFCNIYGKKIV